MTKAARAVVVVGILLVWVRPMVLVAIGALVLLRLAPPILLIFGVADAAGAAWTRATLRPQRTSLGATGHGS